MTHDQFARLSKELEKSVRRPHIPVPHQGVKRDSHSESASEISLGTLLRRNRTYDRAE